MMKFVFFAVVLACCVYVCTAQQGRGVYCGRRLSEMLATLCWGPELNKRSWWVPPAGALAGMRGKRGPVDECCEKSCTIDELMMYC
ncbi:hypothetical protein HF086_010693 [Spodoptera exigua]|uniref:Insulin-like polypeptide B n=1 Tax=Spodoptera exigua TaxID=7107 RepID=A0A385H8W9_SPOEX|nr:insulin-like precursor polypeptide B [Spodoptera exigua]KAH9635010.1 hypothetical protein HF086_010693 [Spodoptera exigua]